MTDLECSPDTNMSQAPEESPQACLTLEESSQACLMPKEPTQACLAPEKPSQAPGSAPPIHEPKAKPAMDAGKTGLGVTLPEAIREARARGVDGFTSPGQADRLLDPDTLITTVEWVHSEYESDLPAVYTVENGSIVNTKTGQTEYAPAEVKHGGGASLAPPSPPAPQPAPPPSGGGVPNWLVAFGPSPGVVSMPPMTAQTPEQREAFVESFNDFRQTVDNAIDKGVFGFADWAWGTYLETENALESSWKDGRYLTHGLLQVKRVGQIGTVAFGSAAGHFVVNIPMGIAQLLTDPVGVAEGMVQAHKEVLEGPQGSGWDYAAKTLEVVSTDALLLLTGARIAGVKGPVVYSRGASRVPAPPPTPKASTPPPSVEPVPPPAAEAPPPAPVPKTGPAPAEPPPPPAQPATPAPDVSSPWDVNPPRASGVFPNPFRDPLEAVREATTGAPIPPPEGTFTPNMSSVRPPPPPSGPAMVEPPIASTKTPPPSGPPQPPSPPGPTTIPASGPPTTPASGPPTIPASGPPTTPPSGPGTNPAPPSFTPVPDSAPPHPSAPPPSAPSGIPPTEPVPPGGPVLTQMRPPPPEKPPGSVSPPDWFEELPKPGGHDPYAGLDPLPESQRYKTGPTTERAGSPSPPPSEIPGLGELTAAEQQAIAGLRTTLEAAGIELTTEAIAELVSKQRALGPGNRLGITIKPSGEVELTVEKGTPDSGFWKHPATERSGPPTPGEVEPAPGSKTSAPPPSEPPLPKTAPLAEQLAQIDELLKNARKELSERRNMPPLQRNSLLADMQVLEAARKRLSAANEAPGAPTPGKVEPAPDPKTGAPPPSEPPRPKTVPPADTASSPDTLARLNKTLEALQKQLSEGLGNREEIQDAIAKLKVMKLSEEYASSAQAPPRTPPPSRPPPSTPPAKSRPPSRPPKK